MAYMGMKTLEDKPRGLPQHKQGRETYLLRVARAVVDKVWNPPGWDDAMWAMAGIQARGGVLTIFWVTGRLGPFDPPFSTYVEFWPLLLGSDVEYWPPFFQAL